MRHIQKGTAPAAYAAFEAGVHDPRTARWRRLRRSHRPALDALWRALLAEQGHACGYCGARVARQRDERAPDAGHIEHVMPKAAHCFPERKFAYDNLMVSCQGRLVGRAPREPRHCGAAKGDWPAPTTVDDFVSPLDPEVAGAFHYTLDGRVEAAAGPRADAAAETIERLKLNQPRLVANRRAALDTWADRIERGGDALPTPAPDTPVEPYFAALVGVLGRFGFLPPP